MGKEQVLFSLPLGINGWALGVSLLALAAAALQMVQSRMIDAAQCRERSLGQHSAQHDDLHALISILYGGSFPPVCSSTGSLLRCSRSAAVPDRRWGALFPALWTDPGLRAKLHSKVPGHHARASECGQVAGRNPVQAGGAVASAASNGRPNTHGDRAGEETTPDMSSLTATQYGEFSGKTPEEALRAARDEIRCGPQTSSTSRS